MALPKLKPQQNDPNVIDSQDRLSNVVDNLRYARTAAGGGRGGGDDGGNDDGKATPERIIKFLKSTEDTINKTSDLVDHIEELHQSEAIVMNRLDGVLNQLITSHYNQIDQLSSIQKTFRDGIVQVITGEKPATESGGKVPPGKLVPNRTEPIAKKRRSFLRRAGRVISAATGISVSKPTLAGVTGIKASRPTFSGMTGIGIKGLSGREPKASRVAAKAQERAASIAGGAKKSAGIIGAVGDFGKKLAVSAVVGTAAGAAAIAALTSFGSDPTPDGTAPGGGGATGPGAGSTGSASEAMAFFVSKGWSRAQAAGIVGNLQAEVGANLPPHGVSGDNGKAYGIAQWHPDRQQRFKQIIGKDIRQSTFKEQLEFVQWELNNSEKKAGDKLRQATTPTDAAAIVDEYYERSAGIHRQRRINNANTLMNRVDDQQQSGAPQQTTPQAPGATPGAPQQQQQQPGSGQNLSQAIVRESGGMTTLKTQSGVSYTVGSAYKERFFGLVNDLENQGYKINSISSFRPGATVAGSGRPSVHSRAGAIDINPSANPHTFPGSRNYGQTDLPSNIGETARKYGLGWGGDWRSSKDTMHFSVSTGEGGAGEDMANTPGFDRAVRERFDRAGSPAGGPTTGPRQSQPQHYTPTGPAGANPGYPMIDYNFRNMQQSPLAAMSMMMGMPLMGGQMGGLLQVLPMIFNNVHIRNVGRPTMIDSPHQMPMAPGPAFNPLSILGGIMRGL